MLQAIVQPNYKRPDRQQRQRLFKALGPNWQTLRVVLLLLAWVMQLLVFLAPLLPGNIRPGHGVCVELAVFQPHHGNSEHLPSNGQVSSSNSLFMPKMASMPAMDKEMDRDMEMGQAHSAKPASSHHAASYAAHHGYGSGQPASHHAPAKVGAHSECSVCLLLGNSVLPPDWVIPLLLTVLVLVWFTRSQTPSTRLLQFLRRLLPQCRAPPVVFA